MQTTQEKIKNYCLANKELKDADINLIKHGHNHDIFLLTTPDNMYVAHVDRGKSDSGSSLYNSFRTLKYLEKKNVQFVPKIVSFNDKETILVETYVGEEHIKFSNLNEQLLDTFVKQLAKIHSLDYKDFQQFCKKSGYDVPQIQTPLNGLEIYGHERFEIVKKLCPDKTVIDWIEPKLKKNTQLVKIIATKLEPGIRQGDIGRNTRMKNGKIWIIDWEFSSIAYKHELAYIKIHSHPTSAQLTFLIKRYAHYSGIPIGDLYNEMEIEERITRVNDVIWAAMKWGENKDSNDNTIKYKKLTHKRMKLYEDFVTFSNSNPDRGTSS